MVTALKIRARQNASPYKCEARIIEQFFKMLKIRECISHNQRSLCILYYVFFHNIIAKIPDAVQACINYFALELQNL